MSATWKRWQDWATVVIGVLLFIAPFVFGAVGSTAAWAAYIGGVLLVIAGLWNLASPATQYIEWAVVIIGVLLFISPWVLGFVDLTYMSWSAWVAGVLAVILGGWDLVEDRGGQRLAVQH